MMRTYRLWRECRRLAKQLQQRPLSPRDIAIAQGWVWWRSIWETPTRTADMDAYQDAYLHGVRIGAMQPRGFVTRSEIRDQLHLQEQEPRQ